MNKNLISYILWGVVIVAAAVTFIIVSNNRTAQAKAAAEKAACEEARADAEKKTAQAEATAETERRRAAEANAKAEADRLAAAKLSKAEAELKAKMAEANAKAAAEATDKAIAEAEIANANRETEKLKAEAIRDEKLKAEALQNAEAAKAATEEARLATEKMKSEKILTEAKLLELQKLDFESAQQMLLEWKLDLEAREAALMPEKTVADLACAGGNEDMTVDADGNLKKVEKKEYDPSKDQTLSVATRALARADREHREVVMAESESVRDTIIGTLEPLYIEAIRADRVTDAEFYRKSIKALYPDWEFKGAK